MSGRDKHIGQLLALVVHDLRNPTAAISANVSFVRESVTFDEPDAREAMEDLDAASVELMRGLDQLAWIGRWLAGESVLEPGRPADLRGCIEPVARRFGAAIDLPKEQLAIAGGPGLTRLLELLLANSALHAPGSSKIRAHVHPESVELEVVDNGRAVAMELREAAFTLEGQLALKGRGDGRYSRVAGLLTARLVADALGATLAADGADGQAIFRITLPRSRGAPSTPAAGSS